MYKKNILLLSSHKKYLHFTIVLIDTIRQFLVTDLSLNMVG